jgi:signal peptide peptidase SppA
MSTTRYSHVASAVLSAPWAVHYPVMDVIIDVLGRRISGERLAEDEIADRIASGRSAGPRGAGGGRSGTIAQIGVYGVLAHRAAFFAETSSGGTSVQALAQAFRMAVSDPEITGILLDVDSPGGQVSGIPELAEEIRAARGQKPIVAVSNTLMASGAYWLASQADELVVTPSSLTGSVGVVMGHEDITGALEQEGVKITLVHAGDHKVETYPQSPLSPDARAHMQSLVDDVHGMFVAGVAKGRGLTAGDVRANFGGGRVLSPKAAVAAGMADRIDTLENARARLGAGKVAFRDQRRAEEILSPAAVVDPASFLAETPDRSREAEAAVALARARSGAR